MKIKKTFFATILIIMVLFSLLSSSLNPIIRIIVIGIFAVVAFVLFFKITHQERKQVHAKIKDIMPISQINPNQYISKAGPVCAGADTRYEVVFGLDDDTNIVLSLSSKQADKLIKGMPGVLIYYDSVFVDFNIE